MTRPPIALLLGALLGSAPLAASATTISPGNTSPPLDAMDCFFDSGALDNVGGADCPITVCVSDCEADKNRTRVGLNVSNVTVGRRFVEGTVYTEFTVDAGTSGAGNELDGTISYEVEWRGIWYLAGVLTGFNGVESSITLRLWDQTDGGRLVRQVEIHHMDAQAAGSLPGVPLEVGASLDHGTSANTLTAKVVRGHTYRIGLRLRAQGKGALNATVNVDYFGGQDTGAQWNDLKVAVSADLEERVDDLERRIAILESQIQHHTHTYLTGRGEGHNNTVATTSEAIIQDEGEPSDEESAHLPTVRSGAAPLPIRSVVEAGVTGPVGPAATIRYVLPEPLSVTIRVYDALGRVVSNLFDGNQPAGSHDVLFNASSLPSGVYYYRLVAGRFVETRKLTLLK